MLCSMQLLSVPPKVNTSKIIKGLKCSVPGGSCTMSPLTSFLVLPSACSTEMALGRLQTGFRRTSRVANVPFMISLNFHWISIDFLQISQQKLTITHRSTAKMARVLTAGKSQKFRPHRSRRCWKRIELDGIMMIHDVYYIFNIYIYGDCLILFVCIYMCISHYITMI